jgi:outer membrane lipoprotein-sorting protein
MEILLYLENNGSGSPRRLKILFFCLRPNWFYFSTTPASILTLNGEFSGVVDASKAKSVATQTVVGSTLSPALSRAVLFTITVLQCSEIQQCEKCTHLICLHRVAYCCTTLRITFPSVSIRPHPVLPPSFLTPFPRSFPDALEM